MNLFLGEKNEDLNAINDAPNPFNSVSILNFHEDRTDKLDLIKIANAFVQSNVNRMGIFGKFTKSDL